MQILLSVKYTCSSCGVHNFYYKPNQLHSLHLEPCTNGSCDGLMTPKKYMSVLKSDADLAAPEYWHDAHSQYVKIVDQIWMAQAPEPEAADFNWD